MKKKTFLLFLVLMVMLLTTPSSSAEMYTLESSDYQFTEEHDPILLPSYRINEAVYVPLHVFADTFHVTVDYDAKTKSILFEFGDDEGKETRLQELTQYVKNIKQTVQPSFHKLYVQGKEIEMPMLLVGGYNFAQIDVIAEGFGYRAVTDSASKTIALTQDEYFGSPYLTQFETYLKNHRIPIDTNDMSVLKEADFDPYNIYLVGENHGIARNFDIQLYFIKYFNQHQNVRYIISEDGFCNTMLLNRYLQTGDTSIIQEMVAGAKGSSAYSKDYYEFYKNVYEYNKTLPEDQKLVFIGIDVQHNANVGMNYLLSLFEETEKMPPAVENVWKILKKQEQSEIPTAVKLLNENEKEFQEYFGSQFDAFRFGLRSIEQGIKFYEENDFSLRETFIHENFRTYYQEYNMKKCFGMFGGAHTLLNGTFDEISNLASFMNNEYDRTKGKVCSIMINYVDCFYMDTKTGASVPDNYSYSSSLSKLLNQNSTTDLTLFPLQGETSPFVKSKFTDAFQYYLCVKNSPAATPYGKLSNTQ